MNLLKTSLICVTCGISLKVTTAIMSAILHNPQFDAEIQRFDGLSVLLAVVGIPGILFAVATYQGWGAKPVQQAETTDETGLKDA